MAQAGRLLAFGRQRLGQRDQDREQQDRTAPASSANTARQVATVRSWPPMTGAATGATPFTSMRVEKNRVIAVPSNRSRTIARASTAPAAAPRDCTLRAPRSWPALGASAHQADPATYSAIPASSGRRRPDVSDSGPASTWPAASPITNTVRVSWITGPLACSSRPMPGMAGRYMSIERAPRALSDPRISVSDSRPRRPS